MAHWCFLSQRINSKNISYDAIFEKKYPEQVGDEVLHSGQVQIVASQLTRDEITGTVFGQKHVSDTSTPLINIHKSDFYSNVDCNFDRLYIVP